MGTPYLKAAPLRERESRDAPSGPHEAAGSNSRSKTYTFLGGFGLGNFGNELTFQAILCHLRRLRPGVEVSCVCTDPVATAALHNVIGLPISRVLANGWKANNRISKVLRSVIVGIPNELYRWLYAFRTLRHTDVLIVPGTGLLTDAYGLKNWGPYSIFKWSLLAKIRRCQLLFVSVGAGPVHTRFGKWLVKSSLALADYRSYRDHETKSYLESIEANVAADRVYPDLAFSLVPKIVFKHATSRRLRPVVGLGLMLYHDKLSSDRARATTYAAYLAELAEFVRWLLARDYDVRLLTGDLSDRPVIEEFKRLLSARLGDYSKDRVIDDPILSAEELLEQLAQTDSVVATRFHNVLLAITLGKPVISISFHQKCTSLMQDMGLPEYCQEIKHLTADALIGQFCNLEKNADRLKRTINEKAAECRASLNEQYTLIFGDGVAG